MTNITLEEIKAQQDKLAQMIELFQSQAKSFVLPTVEIALQPGEHYAGLVLDAATGQPSHHLVLLPGDQDELNWTEAQAWAEEVGGQLPTRQEQALLFANLKREFESTWYWSGEKASSGSAWYQNFYYGSQDNYYLTGRLRVRAVRRTKAGAGASGR